MIEELDKIPTDTNNEVTEMNTIESKWKITDQP